MSNVFDAMREAINNAKTIRNAARANACEMAQFLPGHLDVCDHKTTAEILTNKHTNE